MYDLDMFEDGDAKRIILSHMMADRVFRALDNGRIRDQAAPIRDNFLVVCDSQGRMCSCNHANIQCDFVAFSKELQYAQNPVVMSLERVYKVAETRFGIDLLDTAFHFKNDILIELVNECVDESLRELFLTQLVDPKRCVYGGNLEG